LPEVLHIDMTKRPESMENSALVVSYAERLGIGICVEFMKC
jgi:hypothetical protein